MHRSEFLLRLLEISRAEFAAAEEEMALSRVVCSWTRENKGEKRLLDTT